MLQSNKLPASGAIHEQRREFDAGSVIDTLRAMIGLFRRHWPSFVAIPLVLLTLAGIYLYLTPPLYLANATMVIDAGKVHAFQQQTQSVSTDQPADAVTVQTQVELLKSDAIAAAVVRNLQLQNDPEFVRAHDGVSDDEAVNVAVGAFERGRLVARVPSTYVMEVGFLSHDPEKAARIANAIVEAYINDQLDAKRKSIQAEMSKKELTFNKEQESLGQQKAVLSPDAFAKKVKDFRTKIDVAQRDAQTKSRSFDNASYMASNQIQKSVLDIVGQISKQRGYTIVLPTSTLLYADPKLDITGDVLKQLNSTLPNVQVSFDSSSPGKQ